MNYLDTSALIKRFVAEKGSKVVSDLVASEAPIATSKVAYAEVYSGLTRRRREGHLSSAQYLSVCRDFEADWQAYLRVDLSDDILEEARNLIQRHPLRGFDAIHLASALNLTKLTGARVTFVAADARLLQAAIAENLRELKV